MTDLVCLENERDSNELNKILSIKFLVALSLLLLNDFVLKEQYGNWLTGKLSDFAGLYAFTFFLLAIWPTQQKKIVLFTFLGFAFWKSPFSQAFIDVVNACGLPISRVIDITDLIALPIIFLAAIDIPKATRRKVSRFTKVVVVLISGFAFMATSYSRLSPEERLLYDKVVHSWPREYVSFDYQGRGLKTSKSKDDIILGLKSLPNYSFSSHPPNVFPLFMPFYSNSYSITHELSKKCFPNVIGKSNSSVTEILNEDSLERASKFPLLTYADFEIEEHYDRTLIKVSSIHICKIKGSGNLNAEVALAELERIIN